MAPSRLRLGLLIHQEGPGGIWAPSAETSALLGVAELNVAGGLLGRPVELVVADAGQTEASAAGAAAILAGAEEVDAIVASITSAARIAAAAALRDRIPLVYTPQFEGGGTGRGVVAVGETAAEMLRPGLRWLAEHKRARRFFLIGNDYVWPRRSMACARPIIAGDGGTVVGEAVLPFGTEDHGALLAAIERARPDVVVSWLLGHEAIVFNRAFAAAGLATRMLRFSTAIDETILYAIGAECTENLYVASGYFSNLRSRNNDAFLERYHGSFGVSPPAANSFGQSLYEGIHCLAALAGAAGSLRPQALHRKVGRVVQHRTARGFEREALAGTARPIHLAAADGHDFRMIATL